MRAHIYGTVLRKLLGYCLQEFDVYHPRQLRYVSRVLYAQEDEIAEIVRLAHVGIGAVVYGVGKRAVRRQVVIDFRYDRTLRVAAGAY